MVLYGWRCGTCNCRSSIRSGSFFTRSKLRLQKWLMLMHFWSRQNPVVDASESAQVSPNTAVDVYQWLREVCSTCLINDGPVVLSGPGVIVQIDESLFRHKPKVCVYNHVEYFDKSLSASFSEPQRKTTTSTNLGVLAWLTHLSNQLWGICRLSMQEMQPRCCQSYRLIAHPEALFIQMNGLLIRVLVLPYLFEYWCYHTLSPAQYSESFSGICKQD